MKTLLTQLVDSIIQNDEADQKIFAKIIELSPRLDDSDILNKLIADVQVWNSYAEDFEEELSDFPIESYYQELIKII